MLAPLVKLRHKNLVWEDCVWARWQTGRGVSGGSMTMGLGELIENVKENSARKYMTVGGNFD